jgi:hypothetical protein
VSVFARGYWLHRPLTSKLSVATTTYDHCSDGQIRLIAIVKLGCVSILSDHSSEISWCTVSQIFQVVWIVSLIAIGAPPFCCCRPPRRILLEPQCRSQRPIGWGVHQNPQCHTNHHPLIVRALNCQSYGGPLGTSPFTWLTSPHCLPRQRGRSHAQHAGVHLQLYLCR